jgi:hypothetical protein
MWKRTAFCGALLAAGTLALQWLKLAACGARVHWGEVCVFLIPVAFLALGGPHRRLRDRTAAGAPLRP